MTWSYQVAQAVMLHKIRVQEALRVFLLVNVGLFILGGLRFTFLHIHSLNRPVTQHRESRISQDTTLFPGSSERLADPDADDFIVPNLVHYIWYTDKPRPLQFHHMLSVLSAHRVLSPDAIYFHTNIEPHGKYWELVKQIPSLRINHQEPPTSLFGVKIKPPLYYTSHSNVDRVKILMEYGGIYLDFDTLIIQPFDDLRRHPCTIAQEVEDKACGCIIVCSKDSFFLTLWINSYIDDYRINEWAYNTGKVPFNLAKRYPHLANINKNRLVYPNFMELNKIWGSDSWDWWNNYSVHLYYRLWKDQSPYYKGIEPNEDNVKTMNNTFGQMARMILYGTKELMTREDYS